MNCLRIKKLIYPYKAFYKVPYLLAPWGSEEKEIFRKYFFGEQIFPADDFEREIKRIYKPESNLFFTNSARSALLALFKSLSFPSKSEVIIPALSCAIIAEIIREAGLIPRLADIGEDLCLTIDSIKKAVSPKSIAVILNHAGGARACEYEQIADFCKKNGLFLIDNAAQAWGNQKDGLWLGNLGDAGLVSFGVGKSTFGPGGGLLITKLSKIGDTLRAVTYNKTDLINFYLQYLLRTSTAPMFMCINRFIRKNKSTCLSGISDFDKLLQSSIFKKIDTLINKRTMISSKIISILEPTIAKFPQANNKHVWTKLIIRLPRQLRDRFQKYLYMKKIETEDYYYPKSLSGYPLAEKIYPELLVLPNSPALNECQLGYLYKTIEEFKRHYLC